MIVHFDFNPGIVVPLIQTQVLRLIGGRRGAWQEIRRHGGRDQPAVVNIGADEDDPERNPTLIDMAMDFAAASSPVGRIAPQALLGQAERLTPHGSWRQRPIHGLPFPLNPVQLLIFFNG